ncbi:MAG TPA: isoprenyl transferase [Thiothrix sp.]|nr:isoprenyl transferase [Thiothrix sp.]
MENKSINVPRHIAIVMDGNGRWAKKRFLPRTFGHQRGVESVRNTIRACNDLDVEYLTLFAFSSENWKRPKDEVNALMRLFMKALESEAASLAKNNIQMKFIGDLNAFPAELVAKIRQVEALTDHGSSLKIRIAANYGGKWDIMQAAIKLSSALQQGKIVANKVSEDDLASYLDTADVPDPDLFIRTGGEQRISNFLLWQIAYAELYFTDTLWPDFDKVALIQAVESFSRRSRRFGKTDEQVLSESNA